MVSTYRRVRPHIEHREPANLLWPLPQQPSLRLLCTSMNAWVVRGLVLAAVNVAVRALLGFAIGQWPMQGTPLRMLSLLVVILAAASWGYFDARRDSAAHPDSDEGTDLLMLWLKAG